MDLVMSVCSRRPQSEGTNDLMKNNDDEADGFSQLTTRSSRLTRLGLVARTKDLFIT